MRKGLEVLALLLFLGTCALARADSYCVPQCEPSSPDRPYVPFRCDAGVFGGEVGKVVCGVMHPACSIAFFDNNVCGSGAFRKNLTELFKHTMWVIFHEGCGAWTGDEPVSLDAFRHCYDERTAGDAQELAKLQMKNATDAEQRAAINAAVQQIPTQFNLAENFRWVCQHERLGYQMHNYAAANNVNAIRNLYHEKQRTIQMRGTF